MTTPEKIYRLLAEDAGLSNQELARLAGCTIANAKTCKYRLKERGFIDYSDDVDGAITILRPYDNNWNARKSTKRQALYEEMLEIYMEDFRTAGSFADRVIIGREIRLVLDKC